MDGGGVTSFMNGPKLCNYLAIFKWFFVNACARIYIVEIHNITAGINIGITGLTWNSIHFTSFLSISYLSNREYTL